MEFLTRPHNHPGCQGQEETLLVERMLLLLSVLLLCTQTHQSSLPKSISIRGHPQPQMLPAAHCTSWPVWTCELNAVDGQILQQVDNDAQDGWVNPTSFDSLFYPSDLPLPLARPAIGVVMANGSPRYLMPSVVLTLETPSKMWRNRGLCSIPRASAWIDMFAAFASPIERLRLSSFGQLVPDVRFLEVLLSAHLLNVSRYHDLVVVVVVDMFYPIALKLTMKCLTVCYSSSYLRLL